MVAATSPYDNLINFVGLTHDHNSLNCANYKHLAQPDAAKSPTNNEEEATIDTTSDVGDVNECSRIAILRRTPMHDSLILVKKYRVCLGGHVLEFPVDKLQADEQQLALATTKAHDATEPMCHKRRLITRFFDGDNPIDRASGATAAAAVALCANGPQLHQHQPQQQHSNKQTQLGPDNQGNFVLVPINGLLDRLANYTNEGVAVDGRVYAFAMGIKTAERLLTPAAMRELHETPL